MTNDDIATIVKFVGEHDLSDAVWWTKDGTCLINVNDIFAWGTADAEEVTVNDLPELLQSMKDCTQAGLETYGPMLWVARKRKQRPQGAVYPHKSDPSFEAFAKLFNDCGPVEEVGLGNPYAPGEYKRH